MSEDDVIYDPLMFPSQMIDRLTNEQVMNFIEFIFLNFYMNNSTFIFFSACFIDLKKYILT